MATKTAKSPAKDKKAKEIVEEVLTKKSRKAKDVVDEALDHAAVESKKFYSPADDIDDMLDAIEKKYGLSSSLVDRDEKRLSTGLLALDLLLNGGIVGGGWYTIFGGEQSCKSTLTMTLLCMIQNAIEDLGRKIAASIFDYEGSSDIEYIGNMMEILGLKGKAADIFGLRDDDTGNWLIRPKIRYYMPDSGEDFFRYMAKVKRALPEVQKIGDQYWYVYEHTVENKKKFSGQYDTKYLTKSNKIRIPAPDGFMQAVAIVDSYAAMLPDRLDDDDSNEAMAEQARMFAAGIKKIRSGMRKKRITVFGVNQLRLRPAVIHGSPEYETGGEALKFFCLGSKTRLFTKQGMVTTEEYYQNDRQSLTQLFGKNGLEVPAIFDQTGEDDMIEVITTSGYSVCGKRGHRVQVMLVDRPEEEPVFVRLDELVQNKHHICIAALNNTDLLLGNSDNDYQEAYAAGVTNAKNPEVHVDGIPFDIRRDWDRLETYIKGYSSVLSGMDGTLQHTRDIQTSLLAFGRIYKQVELESGLFSLIQIKSPKEHTEKVAFYCDGINTITEKPSDMTYDANMPDTHTIVSNGIISHNSDVRIKSTSRGSAPYGFVLDKGIMEEDSVTVEGGKDIYRFIVLKTIKNKLGGIPNREVWARVWVADGEGRARGFDPAFDCFEYLKQLGYVDGTRNNLKFHPDVPLHGAKKLSYQDFKVLVLGTKKQITEVCARVGLKKAGNIRTWCANHCASGKGPKRFKDQIVTRSKEKIDTSEDI